MQNLVNVSHGTDKVGEATSQGVYAPMPIFVPGSGAKPYSKALNPKCIFYNITHSIAFIAEECSV